jgi:hypothetical protein
LYFKKKVIFLVNTVNGSFNGSMLTTVKFWSQSLLRIKIWLQSPEIWPHCTNHRHPGISIFGLHCHITSIATWKSPQHIKNSLPCASLNVPKIYLHSPHNRTVHSNCSHSVNDKLEAIRHPALPSHPGCSVSLTLGKSLKNTLNPTQTILMSTLWRYQIYRDSEGGGQIEGWGRKGQRQPYMIHHAWAPHHSVHSEERRKCRQCSKRMKWICPRCRGWSMCPWFS